MVVLLGNHWLKLPTLAGTTTTTCMSCLTIGGPAKEGGASPKTKQKDLGGAHRREEMTNFPGSLALETILTERLLHHQEGPWARPNMSWARKLARDKLTPMPIDCEPWGRAVLLGSLTLLLSAWTPLPNKVFFFFSLLFRATFVAYRSIQARGRIRVAAAGHSHSHNNTRSELHLQNTWLLVAMPDC